MKKILSLIFPLTLLFISCQEQEKFVVDYERKPDVITCYPISSRVFYNEFLATGEFPLTDDYSQVGFYISTNPFGEGPSKRIVATMIDTDQSTFSEWIGGLQTNTVYWVRAFAAQSSDEKLGNIIKVTTPVTKIGYITLGTPEKESESVNSRTQIVFNRVTGMGADEQAQEIDDPAGVIEYGAYYWPSIGSESDAIKTVVKPIGGTDITLDVDFALTLTDLIPSTEYSYRVYARNNRKEQCSEIRTFKSADVALPVVKTVEPEFAGATVVMAVGELFDDGKDPLCEYGFWVGISESDIRSMKFPAESLGEDPSAPERFAELLIGLEMNTGYYIAAYASNLAGEVLGETKLFTTTGEEPPMFRLQYYDYNKVTDLVRADRVTVFAEILSNGGSPIISCGAIWCTAVDVEEAKTKLSKLSTCITATGSIDEGNPLQIISVPITGVMEGRIVYYRIFAENKIGRTYTATIESAGTMITTAAYYNTNIANSVPGQKPNNQIALSQTITNTYYELPPLSVMEDGVAYRYYFLDRNLGATSVYSDDPTMVGDIEAIGNQYSYSWPVPGATPADGITAVNGAKGWVNPANNSFNAATEWNWNTDLVGGVSQNPSPANYIIPTQNDWKYYLNSLPENMRNMSGVLKTIKLGPTGLRPTGGGALVNTDIISVYAADRGAGNKNCPPPIFQARDAMTGGSAYSDKPLTVVTYNDANAMIASPTGYNSYGGLPIRAFRKMPVTEVSAPPTE